MVIQNNLIIFSALLSLNECSFLQVEELNWFIQTICTHVVTQLSSQNNSWLRCLVESFHQTWCAAVWFVIFLTLSKQTVLSPADVLLGHDIKKVKCIMRNLGQKSQNYLSQQIVMQRVWLSVNLFRLKGVKVSHSLLTQNGLVNHTYAVILSAFFIQDAYPNHPCVAEPKL